MGRASEGAQGTYFNGRERPRVPSIASDRIRVVDGDTIRVRGDDRSTRLVGFNAPESGERAACECERDLGQAAKRRLVELVTAGGLKLRFVACSCSAGTEGTPACNFGRRCAVLRARGKDVGAVLIAERLAVPFHCGATRCPATPRPWCG
jgi:micrococcal nuclease